MDGWGEMATASKGFSDDDWCYSDRCFKMPQGPNEMKMTAVVTAVGLE